MNEERKELMEAIQQKCVFRMLRGMTAERGAFGNSGGYFCLSACRQPGVSTQRLFTSPEDAVKALTEAVQAKDETAIDQIFGPSGKDLRSGDKVQDAAEYDELADTC